MKLFLLIQRQAGISRRKAQDLVAAGEVDLDGHTETDPYRMVQPATIRTLSLRGHPLAVVPPARRVYRYYKPRDMLCSHDDPHEGNTVGRVLRAEGFIGYTWAGRLDLDAEGLLLVTNDGDLVHVLSHPRYEVPKTYNVWLDQTPKRSVLDDMLREMEQGIIDQGDRLHILSGRVTGRPTTILLRLIEGKKREIKRLFGHFGLTVVRLQRTAIGPIQIDGLHPGQLDPLSQEQVRALQDSALPQSSSQ